MKNKAWMIYVDIIKFNIFGYIKQQLEETDCVEILWGIDKEYFQMIESGQTVYFYLSGAKKGDGTGEGRYHFLKRFLFKGEVMEITEEMPQDEKFWNRKITTDTEPPFKKYARIRLLGDFIDKEIPSKTINWNEIGKNRRMSPLSDENVKRIEKAAEYHLSEGLR